MQNFSYTVHHIPGRENIADSLSRLMSTEKSSYPENDTEEYLRLIAEVSTPIAMNTCDIEQASMLDEEFQNIRQCMLSGKWYQLQNKEYLTVKI